MAILTKQVVPVRYENANQDLKNKRAMQGTRDAIQAAKPIFNLSVGEQMTIAAATMKQWLQKIQELDKSSLTLSEIAERREYY